LWDGAARSAHATARPRLTIASASSTKSPTSIKTRGAGMAARCMRVCVFLFFSSMCPPIGLAASHLFSEPCLFFFPLHLCPAMPLVRATAAARPAAPAVKAAAPVAALVAITPKKAAVAVATAAVLVSLLAPLACSPSPRGMIPAWRQDPSVPTPARPLRRCGDAVAGDGQSRGSRGCLVAMPGRITGNAQGTRSPKKNAKNKKQAFAPIALPVHAKALASNNAEVEALLKARGATISVAPEVRLFGDTCAPHSIATLPQLRGSPSSPTPSPPPPPPSTHHHPSPKSPC
jgi:hypothetical protein